MAPGGAAAKAGLEPGDVIIAYNGKPIRNRDELVAMVTATKPGTTVPVRVVRDRQERTISITVEELDLDAETTAQRTREPATTATRPEETTSGFGLTLSNITPRCAAAPAARPRHEGAVVTDVEPGSPAARAGLRRATSSCASAATTVATAAEASRELGRIPSGGTAFLRVLRNGQETFVAVTKE